MRDAVFHLALASAIGAASCGSPPMMAGVVTSSGGELGDFTFAPDACDYKPDLQVLDLTDSTRPGITLRVVRPQGADVAVVIANTDARAGGGPREVSLAAGSRCTIHKGYHSVLYGDRGVGVRLDCTTPEGGHIWGTAGAGVCK